MPTATPYLLPLLTALVFAGPMSATAAETAPTETIDRIRVVVNDDIITASEVAARVATVRKRLQAQKVQTPPDAVLERQVTERMVLERLQLQAARSLGMSISDERLDRSIDQIAGQNHKTPAELRAELQTEPGGLAAFREELRNQLLVQQLLDREINGRVTVSDTEVDNFLATQASRGDTEYDLSHILIAVPEKASPEVIAAARTRAEDLHRQLKRGADFSQLAVANSQGQNALEGGRLGWRATGQLPDLFVEALRGLQPGEVSAVLRSPSGFHLLRLNARRGGSAAVNITQTHARHILFKTGELVSTTEATRRAEQLRERLAAGADFAALARTHSEDPGSAANGGDLGWVSPGQTVPDFEKAMDGLQPGQTSAPVASPFGVHLIQVLERRVHDVSRERELAEARRQIQGRKADERYEQWMRQLRDEAYVEFRTDSGG